ncbi:hybrid sensor histidine kinase/response regulator [bacterium]|nr:hybrid sensor histidine kinase/response regulator [bacterium]
MGAKKKVLIVEDDRIVRNSLERLLSNDDCTIDVVETAEEGIERFSNAHHDLVVTDLRLPGMDGIDMVSRLKQQDNALPFIVLSAYGEGDDVLRAMKLGAISYFKKPFDALEVLNLTKQAIFNQNGDKPQSRKLTPANGTEAEIAMTSPGDKKTTLDDPNLSEKFNKLYRLLAPIISLGRQGSGITHNLNGPITGMMGHLELMKMKNPEMREPVDLILSLTKKLRDQIAEIQTKFEYENLDEDQVIDINQVIRAEISYLETDLFFKHYIECKPNLAASLPNIKARYANIALSIEEILINAIDAQRGKKDGKIYITTSTDGHQLKIQIEDEGAGFSEEALERAFEPFWPELNKDEEARIRAGLGLFMARQWLTEQGGEITLTNREAGGACVSIALPLSN